MGVTAFKLGCKLEAASRTQSSLVGGLRSLHMNFIGGLRVGLGKAQRDANSLAQIASLSPSNKKSLEARRFTKPATRGRSVTPISGHAVDCPACLLSFIPISQHRNMAVPSLRPYRYSKA